MNKLSLRKNKIAGVTLTLLVSACQAPVATRTVSPPMPQQPVSTSLQRVKLSESTHPMFRIAQENAPISAPQSYATQLTLTIDKVRDGNYPFFGVLSLMGIMTNNKTLFPENVSAEAFQAALDERVKVFGETTKKAVEAEIKNIDFILGQLRAMSPSQADQSDHEAVIKLYEVLKQMDTDFVAELQKKELTSATIEDYFQTSLDDSLAKQDLTLESLSKLVENVTPFLLRNSTMALREIMSTEPITRNIADHRYRNYYLDVRQELMRNYNAVNRLGTNVDTESKLLQQSLLLQGLQNEILRVIPTDKNMQSHRKLYDWAKAAAKMANNLYELKKTEAALDFDTLSQNTTLMADLGEWTVAVIKERMPDVSEE